MRAYLINTPERRVEEYEYDNSTYKNIARAIRCDIITAVRINDQDDSIYVDDEGLINGNPHGWFMFEGYPQPLRGLGLVLGLDDEGESVSPKCSLEWLRQRIKFIDDSALNPPESYAHSEVHTFDTFEELMEHMGRG